MQTFIEWMNLQELDMTAIRQAVEDIKKYALSKNLPLSPDIVDDPSIQQYLVSKGLGQNQQYIKQQLATGGTTTPTGAMAQDVMNNPNAIKTKPGFQPLGEPQTRGRSATFHM